MPKNWWMPLQRARRGTLMPPCGMLVTVVAWERELARESNTTVVMGESGHAFHAVRAKQWPLRGLESTPPGSRAFQSAAGIPNTSTEGACLLVCHVCRQLLGAQRSRTCCSRDCSSATGRRGVPTASLPRRSTPSHDTAPRTRPGPSEAPGPCAHAVCSRGDA